MKFSQNDEEKIILETFAGNDHGRLLEIGAYHPECFSNSRALIQRGWEAVLVEPSPRCMSNIMRFYAGNPRVTLVNACLGTGFGLVKFHDSEGACATTDEAHFNRWSPSQKDFQTVWVPSFSPRWITHAFGEDFDFISIDTEGNDLMILQELPISSMKRLRLLCVEYGNDLEKILSYAQRFGFREIHRNGENTILERP